MKTSQLIFLFLSFLFCHCTFAQIGAEVGYVLAPKKESFAARIYGGNWEGIFRIGAGFEMGNFNSRPTERSLPYFSIKLGSDYDFLPETGVPLYAGVDFEYLRTTRIIDDYRISIFPKVGTRLFNVFYVELSGDNLNEPGSEKRIFSLEINSYRITFGFHHYFGGYYHI